MKKHLFIFTLLFLACFFFSSSAQISVSGRVTDANGHALEGVTVAVKGTSIGTITRQDGSFSLNGVPSSNSILSFSFIGFTTQEVMVGNRRTFNISLETAQSALDTMVVVGYGTARKADFTGSATTVNSSIISNESISTVTSALEGVVPGIQVSSVDGQPGLDMGIRLRGVSSTSQNSSNALIVIDGVPSQYSNILSTINPDDIQSVTVLKDAVSTAIYGSRGANGVILVTTKRGRKGPAKITLSDRVGFNYLPKMIQPKLIQNAKDVYEYTWLAIYNSVRYGVNGTSSTDGTFSTNVQNPNMSESDAALFASQHLFDYNGSMTNFSRNWLGNWMLYYVPGAVYTPTGLGTTASSTMSGAYLVNPDGKLNPNAKLLFPAGSYRDYFFNKPFRQDLNLSASGGTDMMDYFVSLGMLDDPSYITGSSFKRYNVRANLNAQLTSWLKIGENSSFDFRNTRQPATRYGRNPGTASQNVFYWVDFQNPLVSLFARDQNGQIIKNPDGTNKVVDNANLSYSPLGPTSGPISNTNLIELLNEDINRTKSYDLDMSGYATVTFLKDFSFTTNLTYQRFTDQTTRYGNMETGASKGVGALSLLTKNTNILNTQQLLNWNRDYGKHSISALLGHEFDRFSTDYLIYTSAYSLINGFIGSGNFTSRYYTGSAPFGNPGAGGDLTAMDSYFGRVKYNYADKYFFEGSMRRDGSSKFRYNKDRWGTFWSVGLGWRISAEDFMKSTAGWLNDLKLRASYGVIGNESGIPYYSGYQIWYLSANYQTSSSGVGIPASFNLSQGPLPNPSLTWENTHTFDAGVDFTLWNDRLNGSIDYFNKNTVNSVFAQPLAMSLGQSSITRNNADLVDRGVEVDLNADIIRNKNFRWNIGLNGSHYRTILMKVPPGVGDPQLGGKFTGSTDPWDINGGGSSGGHVVYLRGEGMDYYNLYLYKYNGVDQTTGLPLFQHTVTQADHDNNLFTDKPIGSYVSTTNYTLADRYSFGSALPQWIGGVTTSFYYKNFDLSAVIAYQLGGKFLSVAYANGFYVSGAFGDDGNGVSTELLNNTWTPQHKNAKFPMLFYHGFQNYTSGSTIGSWAYTNMALFSASYFNLKNITFGYRFNNTLLQRLSIESLRVYLTAQEPVFLTSHSGIDPRMSLVGGMEVGAGYYLPMSSISVGLDVTF
ncbi:MAG: SusC/RagA family TonB-linked outer membrane protein [Acidobacterium ailaaui]|nr:SusC/RagA family TonB-linked outer membrane protein [Pseudacidobacterium ailaaui]